MKKWIVPSLVIAVVFGYGYIIKLQLTDVNAVRDAELQQHKIEAAEDRAVDAREETVRQIEANKSEAERFKKENERLRKLLNECKKEQVDLGDI